jgi:phosphatidylglycerophosphatase C
VPETRADARLVVAAFDVDGTLTTRDCVTPFLLRATRGRLPLALVRRPLALGAALFHRDRDRLKELAAGSLRGLDAAGLDRLGVAFARGFVSERLRPDTTARLRRHLTLGHTVVLASASLEPYVVPIGESLGVHGVVCTRLEQDASGRLTGRLQGANCRGPEKARRLRAWLEAEGLADAEVWAYGDSAGDKELLGAADHPVWVRRVEILPEPLG